MDHTLLELATYLSSSNSSRAPTPANSTPTPRPSFVLKRHSHYLQKSLKRLEDERTRNSKFRFPRKSQSFPVLSVLQENKDKRLSYPLPSFLSNFKVKIDFSKFKRKRPIIKAADLRIAKAKLGLSTKKTLSPKSSPKITVKRSVSDVSGSKLSIKQRLKQSGRLKNSIIIENEDAIAEDIENEIDKGTAIPTKDLLTVDKPKTKLKHSQSMKINPSPLTESASSEIHRDLNILFYTNELPDSSPFQFSPPINREEKCFSNVYKKEHLDWMHIEQGKPSRDDAMQSSTLSEPCQPLSTRSQILVYNHDYSDDEPEYCEVSEVFHNRGGSNLASSTSTPALYHNSEMKVSLVRPVSSIHSSEGMNIFVVLLVFLHIAYSILGFIIHYKQCFIHIYFS